MDPTTNEVRRMAVDNTKIGGDRMSAIALALVYVGDSIGNVDNAEIGSALRDIAAEVGSVANQVSNAGAGV